MSSFLISILSQDANQVVLKIGFNPDVSATNDVIVKDAIAQLQLIIDSGVVFGKAVFLNGPASLPASAAIGHRLAHVCKAVGVFDPKLNGFVVAISHDPDFKVGDVIPA